MRPPGHWAAGKRGPASNGPASAGQSQALRTPPRRAQACLALAAPAEAQFNPFNRQAPPADVPGDANESAQLVLRVGQLEEELRQANGRIEELENAQHRLETELQKFRQDVEFRFGDRSEGAPRQPDVAEAPQSPGAPAAPSRPRKSDAFDPDADPNAPGAPRPLGTSPPSAPLVRETPTAPAGQPLELGKAPPAAPPASGPTIVGSGVAMLDQPREQFNAALQALQAGQYPEAEAAYRRSEAFRRAAVKDIPKMQFPPTPEQVQSGEPLVVLAAALLGATRLIDNVEI